MCPKYNSNNNNNNNNNNKRKKVDQRLPGMGDWEVTV
jgi:hypothetical protein